MPDDEQQPQPLDPHTACSEHLAACEARAAELEAKWKRALADRANEEKANARAREEFAKYATASVLRDLLPIVDAVDAALCHSEEPGDEESHTVKGLRGIQKQMDDLLTHHGVARIPCDGKPDYTLHEIVSTRAVEGAEPGAIIEVVQQGYTMHGQCLRPAKVIVATEQQHTEEQDV